MEASMGPPLLPRYSLRVMLFRANAYHEGDRPVRCFRVVTSPDATVRDFCQEASRIHEINYGEPIAIKKVQDDQEFDITQGELLGSLFKNLDTIRVIQAATQNGVRDSLPPTSALRYDPGATRKREREASIESNGSAQSVSWKPNKRQRILDVDPDHPLPSREVETRDRRLSVIPDSQETVIRAAGNGVRHVRQSLPRKIPRTPSPPPSLRKSTSGRDFADHGNDQSEAQSSNDKLNLHADAGRSTPTRSTSRRAQSLVSNPPRAKSASYHIPRSNERGASVSTAATSPLSVDQQAAPTVATTKRKREESIRPNHKNRTGRVSDEHSIYEPIVSDEEDSAISKAKKLSLKSNSLATNKSNSYWTTTTLNTPTNGNRRGSGNHELATTPGELPLTPNSRAREQARLDVPEKSKKAGMATEAVEMRKREEDEGQLAEASRMAAGEQAKREGQERLEVEDSKRGEAGRNTASEKSVRLQNEKEAREKKAAENQKRAELETIAKEKAAAAEQKKIDDLEAKRAKRVAEDERQKKLQEDSARIRLPSSSPAEARPPASSSPILPRGTQAPRAHSGTPFIPPRKSALRNVASSQAMRSSSPADPSRSPETTSNGVSIETQMPMPRSNRRVSFKNEVEHNINSRILPPAKTYTSTPLIVTPQKPIITPQKSVVKLVAKTPIAAVKAPSSSTAILPPKRPILERTSTPSMTPAAIIPANANSTLTPVKSTLSSTPMKTSMAKSSPAPGLKKVSPPTSQTRRNETPVRPPPSSSTSNHRSSNNLASGASERSISVSSSVGPIRATPSRAPAPPSESSNSEEEDAVEERKALEKPSLDAVPRSDLNSKQSPQAVESADQSEESGYEDEKMEDNAEVEGDETQSHNSSTRDSRSPVSFIQHAKALKAVEPSKLAPPQSNLSSKNERMLDVGGGEVNAYVRSMQAGISKAGIDSDFDAESSDADENEDKTIIFHSTQAPISNDTTAKEPESESESESSESEEEEEIKVQVPESSPPVLPVHQSAAQTTSPKLSQGRKSKDSSPEGYLSIQDQIDQQLTSSLYEVDCSVSTTSTPIQIPASSSIFRPPVMKFGASLTSLHQNKFALSSSSQPKALGGRNGQVQPKPTAVDDEESDSSESESNESSSDDDEKPSTAKRSVRSTAWVPIKKLEAPHVEDSDSEDESDDDDDEAERRRARNELAAQVAAIKGSQASITFPSPKKVNLSTQQSSAPKSKEKIDKYTTGYTFSQVR